MITSLWKIGKKHYDAALLKFPWLKNFILYAIIGLMAAVLDYSIFFVISYFHILKPEIASLIGNICGFMFTFTGNTFYNFKRSNHVIFRFISYLSITICGMTLSTVLIHYGKTIVNVYLLKTVLVLMVIPAIQFVLNKKITYRNFDD